MTHAPWIGKGKSTGDVPIDYSLWSLRKKDGRVYIADKGHSHLSSTL